MKVSPTVPSVLVALACLAASPVLAQSPAPPARPNALHDLNTAIEALTASVAPSVVQVLVTGYRPVDEPGHGDTGVIGRQRSSGSGAIIDAEGYIVTNAHVVAGAQQVRVVLHSTAPPAGPLQALTSQDERTVPARIVGLARDIDLALLKVDVTGLKALRMADYRRIQQGELVFAFGSPEGLRNSVTMGVVSSTARQLDQDSPNVFIQTDAPINPGNSGGPLVNVDGELVGLSTLILTESGGSQGLGFAIPSVVVTSAYPQLRQYGHLHRGVVGLNAQAITAALAEGLALPRTSGVVVSDVASDGPAGDGGVEVGDIILSVNGRPISSVPVLTLALNTVHAGDTVVFGLMRGDQTLSASVAVAERPHEVDQLSDLGDPDKNGVPKLGVVGVDLDETTRAFVPGVRIPTGVLVTARRLGADVESPIMAGDVIHGVNGVSVHSLNALQVLTDGYKAASQVIVQIERDRRLQFVTVTIY